MSSLILHLLGYKQCKLTVQAAHWQTEESTKENQKSYITQERESRLGFLLFTILAKIHNEGIKPYHSSGLCAKVDLMAWDKSQL